MYLHVEQVCVLWTGFAAHLMSSLSDKMDDVLDCVCPVSGSRDSDRHLPTLVSSYIAFKVPHPPEIGMREVMVYKGSHVIRCEHKHV